MRGGSSAINSWGTVVPDAAGGFGLCRGRGDAPAVGGRGCSGEKPWGGHGGDGGQSVCGGQSTQASPMGLPGAGAIHTLLRCFHSSAHSRSVSRWSITSSCRAPCTAARQEQGRGQPPAAPLSLGGCSPAPCPITPPVHRDAATHRRAAGARGAPGGRGGGRRRGSDAPWPCPPGGSAGARWGRRGGAPARWGGG